MNKLFITAILILVVFSANAFAQVENKTFFQTISGNWEGTLEYQDYSANKRVKLKTYLTIMPAADGNSTEFLTIYDDFGKIIKDAKIVEIDSAAKQYFSGETEYKIDLIEAGKIILLGSGQDGEKIEPSRTTITFDSNSLVFLKETRTPWQFRNQLTLRRTNKTDFP